MVTKVLCRSIEFIVSEPLIEDRSVLVQEEEEEEEEKEKKEEEEVTRWLQRFYIEASNL